MSVFIFQDLVFFDFVKREDVASITQFGNLYKACPHQSVVILKGLFDKALDQHPAVYHSNVAQGFLLEVNPFWQVVSVRGLQCTVRNEDN